MSTAVLAGCLLALAGPGPLAAQVHHSSHPLETPRLMPPPPATAPGDTASNPVAAPGIVASIAVGETMRGALQRGDLLMSDSTYADLWEFAGGAGETVEIDLRSEEFDTFLQLLDPSWKVIAEDDDSGGDLNSSLTATLPAAGTYRIVVNSAGHERRVGAYTLTLR